MSSARFSHKLQNATQEEFVLPEGKFLAKIPDSFPADYHVNQQFQDDQTQCRAHKSVCL